MYLNLSHQIGKFLPFICQVLKTTGKHNFHLTVDNKVTIVTIRQNIFS